MKKTSEEIFRDKVELFKRDKIRQELIAKAIHDGTLVDPGECPIHKTRMVFYFEGSDITKGYWECWACKWKKLSVKNGRPLPQMYFDLLKKVEGPKSKVQGQ